MFQLIQRGQIYADQHGWPVIIHSCTSQIVRYWRQGVRRRRYAQNWRRASTLNRCAPSARHEEGA